MNNQYDEQLQNILYRGEEVLEYIKPKKLCYYFFGDMPFFAALLFCIVFAGVLFSFGQGITIEGTGNAVHFIKTAMTFLFFFILFCGLLIYFIRNVLAYKNIAYIVTNRRLIKQFGIIGLNYKDAQYTEINQIKCNVSPIDKILGVGQIAVVLNGVDKVRRKDSDGYYRTEYVAQKLFLFNIKNPYETYKLINQVYTDINSDIHLPNDFRTEDNSGYTTLNNSRINHPIRTSEQLETPQYVNEMYSRDARKGFENFLKNTKDE